MALKLAGVQPGDEVISYKLSFVATDNNDLYCRAIAAVLKIKRDTLDNGPRA